MEGSVHSDFCSSAGQMIIQCAENFNADHIVMGSRGLGVISRSILGSVSHFVLDHTKVPVTIIPRETKDSFMKTYLSQSRFK